MKLDKNDIVILKALLEDGRGSFREIARRTSLTTPTVSYHFSRMMKSGFIKKFTPVLDKAMLGESVSALITLRIKAGSIGSVTKRLSALPEVSGLFVTTGENNVTLRVSCADPSRLQDLLNVRLPKLFDGDVVSSQLIVSTVKDEQSVNVPNGLNIKLRCDLCREEITSDRPYVVRVGTAYHYFCCRTCRRSYLDRYGHRIMKINASRKSA